MRPKPVDAFLLPGYPTRDELLADRSVLDEQQPQRWRLGRDLAGAATFFLALSITGCETKAPAEPPSAPAAAESQADAPGDVPRAVSQAGAVVAPIFNHGEGRGVTGCVVVSPPAFLSEDEAMQIIREELAKQKIDLKAGTTLKDVAVAPRVQQQVQGTDKTSVVAIDDRAMPLLLDGCDESSRVAVEFLSLDDYDKLGGVDPESYEIVDADGNFRGGARCSVSSYDFKDAAKYLAGQIQRQEKQRLFVGVLYDPMAHAGSWSSVSAEERKDPEAAWAKLRQKGKAKAEDLLRQQARDFVEWLKTQGAL